MSKRYRKQTIYTIDEEVLSEFNEVSENLSINRSRLIEQLMKNWLVQIKQPVSRGLSVKENKLIV